MYLGKFTCLCLVLLCKVITETYLYPAYCGIDQDGIVSTKVALQHHQFWRAKTTDVEDCARVCVKRKLCKSFNFDTGTRQCELNDDVYNTGKEIRSGEDLIYSNIAQWPAEIEPNCFHRPCGFDEICIPGHLTGNDECSYTCLKLVPTSIRLSTTPIAASTPTQLTQSISSTSQGTTPDSHTSTPFEGADPQSYPPVIKADETVFSLAPSTQLTPASQMPRKNSPVLNTTTQANGPRSYPTVITADETEANKTTAACGDLPVVLNGWVVRTGEFAFVECDIGFTLEGVNKITCLTTGEWNSTSVICKSNPFAGKDFVTVFPRVGTGGHEDVLFRQIFITSPGPTRVSIISQFQDLDRTFTMSHTDVQNFSSSYTLTEDRTTNNKVIQVKANRTINVHTFSYKNGTNQKACDSFYNLPRTYLKTEYILITTEMTPQFSVTGIEHNTNVEIKLTNHNSSFSIKLNKSEVFNFFKESDIDSTNDRDLTGSIITSNEAVAIISGGFFAQIPFGTEVKYDMSAVQLPGVSDWFHCCIMAPFMPRLGFEYKIVASENDTLVDVISDKKVTTVKLNRAEKIAKLYDEAKPLLVNATKPILVATFSFGEKKKSTNDGDSSMILCQYPERYLNSYAFSVPAHFDNFVRIIIQDSYTSYLRLNNMPLTPFKLLYITAPTGITHTIIYITVDEMKYYTLESTNGARFGADMYGLARATQYSHRLGSKFSPSHDWSQGNFTLTTLVFVTRTWLDTSFSCIGGKRRDSYYLNPVIWMRKKSFVDDTDQDQATQNA